MDVAEVEAEEEVDLMKDKIGIPFNGEIVTSMATKMLIAGANQKMVPYNVNTARSMDIEMLIVGAKRKASNTVPHVPSLAHNLLSVRQFMYIGHSILFDDSCVIKDKKSGKIVANMTQNRIFPFDISTVESFDLVAGASVKNIWHLRYGHLSINGLQFLEHKGMVIGLPKIDTIDFCEDCVYGNQSRPSFPVRYSM
ncbi:retrovirus-related pol polyprotein from transposon TNT 1-94 [Tanacetum coccineum]